jgi:putative ABC transport system permease protein
MNLAVFAVKNVTRNKLRVFLTILGVGVAVVAFLLLRTVLWSWSQGADAAAKDRVATRHRVSFVMQLPKRYAQDIKDLDPRFKAVTWANWFGGKDPKDEQNFFAALAVDHTTFLDVYNEMAISPEAKEKWLSDPQACLIGPNLAKKMHVQAGQDVTLTSQIYPGEWKFHVAAIYEPTAKSIDPSQFLFHWDYLNKSMPPQRQDTIGWIVTKIDDPAHSGELTTKIDKLFEERDTQTLSMSERSMNLGFMGMFSAVLTALQIVSIVILVIVLLILGNTIAMGVRERTYEYGVLRAIGFRNGHITGFIVGEALLIGLLGGLAGLALAMPLIEGGFKRFISESPMAAWFPFFQITPLNAGIAIGAVTALGALASSIPAYLASRVTVTNALRRVG